LNTYTTLAKDGTATLVEKRSEFIGYAKPVNNEDEAAAFVMSIKKKHADARHNVFAYVLRGGALKRYSDDGEPQGSAGMPVLDVICKNGLDGAAVVVTRYFGGILLGTGGLVRAYSSAASAAIADAGIICNSELVGELFEAAKKAEVLAQADIKDYASTDAAALQYTKGGAKTGAIAVPVRNIHTPAETVDLNDAVAVFKTVKAFIEG
jgi:uncharacterized YigZ family protein